MNIWSLIGGAAVQTLVSVLLGAYVRRQLRLNRQLLEPLAIVLDVKTQQGKGARVNLREYRKAIAAGAGVALTGLLTWATTDGVLEQLLEPVVPEPVRPLIGIAAGGLATVLAVIRATNEPKPEPVPRYSRELQQHYGSPDTVAPLEPPTIVEPAAAAVAPPIEATVPAAAAGTARPRRQPTQWQAGVPQETSVVQLLPAPTASPL